VERIKLSIGLPHFRNEVEEARPIAFSLTAPASAAARNFGAVVRHDGASLSLLPFF